MDGVDGDGSDGGGGGGGGGDSGDPADGDDGGSGGGGVTPSFLCPHGHHRYSCSYSSPPTLALMKWIEQDYIP